MENMNIKKKTNAANQKLLNMYFYFLVKSL